MWSFFIPVTAAILSDDMRLTERQLAYWTEDYAKIDQMLLGNGFYTKN